MTRTEQKKILYDQMASINAILDNKGEDYAGEEDVLAVFKQVGAALNISPLQVASMFIVTKIARLNNLLQKEKTPNHESIGDSFLDLQSYALLMEQIYIEQQLR